MMRPEKDSSAARDRASEAAEWLVRRDRGLSASEQDEFLQWLAADPRHGEWFALHRSTVGDFGLLSQWRPEHSDQPNPDLLAPPRRFHRWLAPVAVAAASIVLVLGWLHFVPAKETGAVIADYERRILNDGSTVELNRGAVVNVVYSAGERRVILERGEALFTVTTNADRPFIVRAGGVDVRAIGTAFNVRLDASEVEVLVTAGRVAVATSTEIAEQAVRAPRGARLASKAASGRGSIEVGLAASARRIPSSAAAATAVSELIAGQRAVVSLTTIAPPVIETVTAAVAARLLAWQPQLLDFSSVPLERAILEFNRRNRVQFSIADAELAAMPIVASIRSDNVEGFAQFLASTPGIQLERRGDAMIVLRRND